jgi:hypothetical protein
MPLVGQHLLLVCGGGADGVAEMNTTRQVQYAFLLAMCAIVGACQYMGVPKAETFNQRVAGAYTSVTTTRDTTRLLLNAGHITTADAQNVQDQCDNARLGIDIARTIRMTDPGAAETKLTSILAALTALDAYLKSRGAP